MVCCKTKSNLAKAVKLHRNFHLFTKNLLQKTSLILAPNERLQYTLHMLVKYSIKKYSVRVSNIQEFTL